MGARRVSRMTEYALLMVIMGIVGAIVLRWHIVEEKREVAQLVRTLRKLQ